MSVIIDVIYVAIGCALFFWAAPLSLRYNAWTTGLRERHPNINPPPTPERRALNTKIMIAIFRIAGVFLIMMIPVTYLLSLIGAKPR